MPKSEEIAVPSWMVKAIVGTLITALIGGAAAWGRTLSTKANSHETRITVTEDRVDRLKGDVAEIKDGVKEMNRKLDRLIERRR